jgi:hypothetical protein
MPGDVDHVHRRLVRARDQERLTFECIHRFAGFGPGDVEAGNADPAILGDAKDAEVEQGVVEGAEGQGVGDLVGAVLAVLADVGRLDRHRVWPRAPSKPHIAHW